MALHELLRAEAASEDNLFMSIDRALAKLEKQILRHRTRLDKRLREGLTADTQPEFIEDLGAGDQEAREVVRSKTYTVRPMSQEDAVMQMELLGHSFFVYVDLDTNHTHVLYLRRDDWPEQDCLIDWLKRNARCCEIDESGLVGERLQVVLTELWDQFKPSMPIPTGANEAALIIASSLES